MSFDITPVTLGNGETITSLYHSPFDLNLLHIILFARTGLRLRVVLDDIDNTGVDRTGCVSNFAYQEKYFLSKTERTNTRALSLIMPKNLMANLSLPSLKELDTNIGIRKLKDGLGYTDSVEHWIRDVTRQYGSYSIIGPDKAFAFTPVDTSFVEAISDAKFHISSLLKGVSTNSEQALKFTEWLLEVDPVLTPTVSDYYHNVLEKVITHFGLGGQVTTERMSDLGMQRNNLRTLESFLSDASMRSLYARAIAIDGKKDVSDMPFYSVSRRDGQRLLPIESYLGEPSEYLIAPKVFMLNNFHNLILPYHAMNNPHIHAREVMYSHKDVNCNQIFYEDKWLERLSVLGLEINLNEVERGLLRKARIHFSELLSLENTVESNKTTQSISPESEYEKWIISASTEAVRRLKYPVIFLALLGDKIFYESSPAFYKLTTR